MDIKFFRRNIGYIILMGALLLLGTAAQNVLAEDNAVQTPATFIVNTTDDNDYGSCDASHCSLREALNAANASPSPDLITFAIPGVPPFTIQPQSPLPGLDNPVTIDGTTQLGYAGNPVIELNGSAAGEGTNGLSIGSGNSTVKGLLIDGFLGTGIAIGDSANNVIEGNVLSGNAGAGISIAGETAAGNVVRGNLIGTTADGTGAWSNTDGIWLGGNTHNNIIGGTTPEDRNIISGNAIYGISSNYGASQNQIIGNYIGTDRTGSLPVGNGAGGILLGSGSNNNDVGGTQGGEGNLISGNWGNGLTISDPGSSGNVAQGNYVGTGPTGTTVPPEATAYTVEAMEGTVATYPAGTNMGGYVTQSDNPLAPWFGKSVGFYGTGECGEGSICPSRLIYRYKLEFAVDTALTSVAVSGAAFNGPDSYLQVLDADNNVIGTTDTFGGNSFQTFYIRMPGVVGMVFYIEEYDTSNNYRFRQSIVVNGPAPMGNRGIGVLISGGAADNLIGGDSLAARNLISGNFGPGVSMYDPGTTGNTVQGNTIGVDVSGMQALPNYSIGVHISNQASNNQFLNNLISGNLGDGMTISSPGTNNNVVQGNLVGTDASGNSAMPNNGVGVWIGDGATGTLVGGVEASQGNLISGNAFGGVGINQLQTTGTRLLGNTIGTNRNGDNALPNGGDGVFVSASQSIIGGAEPGAGNLISGNAGTGLVLRDGAAGNIVQGNRIGTDVTGSKITGLPGPAVGEYNVSIVDTCPTYAVGDVFDSFVTESIDPLAPWSGESVTFKGTSDCPGSESLGVAKMIYRYKLEFAEVTQLTSVAVSGAAFNGPDNVLRVLDENMNVLGMTNTFGGNSFQTIYLKLTDGVGKVFYVDEYDTSSTWRFRQSFVINGPEPLGNLGNGVIFGSGATGNLVGGTAAGAGNLISGNRSDAVGFFDAGTNGNRLEGNFIGTDATGTFALPNNSAAVWIGAGASNNIIGGDNPAARNVISGNNGDGVSINNAESSGNVVRHNYIGTNATGNGLLGNFYNGIVMVSGTNNNLIANNLISSNGGSGVVINDLGTSNNLVQGNLIGTDANGAAALPNNGVGVWIGYGASNNIVGGASPAVRNVISGNNGGGVGIGDSETTGNEIRRNYIGTDASGTKPLPNLSNGVILLGGTNNNLIALNLISANGGDGVAISDPGTDHNKVQANHIGTDVTGMLPMGNGSRGVVVAGGASANLITGNLISASGAAGVRLDGDGTEGNKIQGNLIGTDITGKGALGNGYIGVRITDGAANNLVGGVNPGEGNTIAFNVDAGITLNSQAGSGNSLLGNSIFSNGKMGIDLNEDGITLNDILDGDQGPNGLQNFPVLNGFTKVRGSPAVSGSLNSLPNSAYRIEFFSNATCDPDGYGEGEQFLGFINVTTDLDGNAVFTFSLPKNFSPTACVTATATDAYGSTSEFSACLFPTRE